MTAEFQPPVGRREKARVEGVRTVLRGLVLHSTLEPEPYLSTHYRPATGPTEPIHVDDRRAGWTGDGEYVVDL